MEATPVETAQALCHYMNVAAKRANADETQAREQPERFLEDCGPEHGRLASAWWFGARKDAERAVDAEKIMSASNSSNGTGGHHDQQPAYKILAKGCKKASRP